MKEQGKAKLFSLKYLVFDIIKISAVIPTLIWLRPKREYIGEGAKRKIRGGALLIANHTALLDPIYMLTAVWYRRQRFVISEELMASKAAWLFRLVGCIEINRQNPTLGSFREIINTLKSGEAVSIFPEGRIADSAGGSFKSGMVLMALKSGVPIVPIYIRPRKGIFDRLRVTIGESVSVRELYGDRPTFAQISEATELLREREEQLREYSINEKP